MAPSFVKINTLVSAVLLLVLSTSSTASSATAQVRGPFAIAAGMPRGGGWFGSFNKTQTAVDGDDDKNPIIIPKLYPALSQEEIEKKLNAIPLHAVSHSGPVAHIIQDRDGRNISIPQIVFDGHVGTYLQEEEDGTDYCWKLFFSQQMAEMELKRLEASGKGEFELCQLPLGRVWYELLKKQQETIGQLRARLMPDMEAKFWGIMAGNLDKSDFDQLLVTEGEEQKRLFKKAAEEVEGKRFHNHRDDIPLFYLPRCHAVVLTHDKENLTWHSTEEHMTPLFFSFIDLLNLTEYGGPHDPDTIQVIELGELVEMMEQESEYDFRHNILLPITRSDDEEEDDDDDIDDDNDGGGGGGDHNFGYEATAPFDMLHHLQFHVYQQPVTLEDDEHSNLDIGEAVGVPSA